MSITSVTGNTLSQFHIDAQPPSISHWIFFWSKYKWRIEGTKHRTY